MGNDGGSIPKRRELVKNAARAPTISELKATALESLAHAWAHCALSDAPLDLDAVVSDWRGRLYSYEAILKGLMPSDDPNEVTPASLGIRSLRDVAKLKFSKTGDKWACPISMKEMGPATKAVYLVPCGHAFAEVAITEIKEEACPECGEAFTQENVIAILPTAEKDLDRLQKRIEDLQATGLTHTLKKGKSDKKKKRKAGDAEEEGDAEKKEDKAKKNDANRAKKETDSRIKGINNSMAATLTARVLAEQDERNKRRKLAQAAS
ncbi:rtf2 RING-finger domain-containing protein [Trichoderma breve]|uniref:Rtf2 RING-finger domain-containing protein n=1 Tax=Trichoderma breve TaxID=2034170 RepID=A0A9W9BLV0_9HYPO|nr:rtf2 RING-finger domain-containing protein [Trichoderma breve]KAJ4862091.1 rtf2 RING-finger domain-containing protein [Trichoderma breve]